MKLPLSWLREYVEFDAAPEALAEKLTFAGLEVESVQRVGSDFAGLVVGEVLSVQPHPNADRLLLCDVAVGGATARVVCGAPNVRPGDKAPFAGIGVKLPNGMAIKSAKIRGELSQGMLCAEDELGLSEAHEGLLQLPRDLAAGAPLADVLGGADTVLTLEVTPNRPDCLSVIGIAREVAALCGSRLKFPAVEFAAAGAPLEGLVDVAVNDAEGCPRYVARLLHDVVIGPSPIWMRLRLARSGVRPINTVVDITNYVMLECGQPLHAFDLSLIRDGRIIVRRALAGETIVTLDEVERKLTPEMLVIADAQSPVAVAGVMGGARSGILDSTRSVILESAAFKPALIRKTSRQLGLSSESSYRFERGVDIGGTDWASRRAAALMVQYAGAVAAQGALDRCPALPAPRRIVCRFERVRSLLGCDIADEAVTDICASLALPVVARTPADCVVEAPTFRPDLESEVDLIEEVARMHGLDKIPARAPRGAGVAVSGAESAPALGVCRRALVGLGLYEIMNYSFVSAKLLDFCDAGHAAGRVVLPNPVSAEQGVLRNSLLPQMLETLGRNRSRQIADAAFFEIGRVFFPNTQGNADEEERLAIGLMGPVGRIGFGQNQPVAEADAFLWLKGIMEALARALRADSAGFAWMPLVAEDCPRVLNSARSVSVAMGGAVCGVCGLIGQDAAREWRMADPVALLEVRLAPFLKHVACVPGAEPLPVYPSVARDVAMLVRRDLRHADVLTAIRDVAPQELTKVELFDIFAGETIGAGRKSMAYSMTYRSAERTLTDDEVNVLHEKLKESLRAKLAVEIRAG